MDREAPAQLGFLETIPAAHPVRMAMHGQLAEQPHVRHHQDGSMHVVVHLQVPEGDLPIYTVLAVPAAQREALRFMRFSVLPGSSAPGSRLARARMMAELVKLGAASRRDVLLAADFQDPDEMLKRAQEDAGQNPVFQAMAKKEGKPE